MKGRNLPFRESPSQTAGPYVHIGLMPDVCGVEGIYGENLGTQMRDADTPGTHITITGKVYDGGGELVKDALIEIWQADANGVYPNPVDPDHEQTTGFPGWGRRHCDFETGIYKFETIKPGATDSEAEIKQAPHISFWVVARGINIGLNTRMYFPDEPLNDTDPVLQMVPPERRNTLIANGRRDIYEFNIYLQGENETVFFDI